MSYDVHLSWKILLTIDPEILSCDKYKKLFNRKSGKSFVNKIGGIDTPPVEPITLDPTVVFHNALSKVKTGLGFFGKKFPYQHKDGSYYNFSIRCFFYKYIVISLTRQGFYKTDATSISEDQSLDNHECLYTLSKHICGLVVSGDHSGFKPLTSLKVYPCTVVYAATDDTDELTDRQSVEILTRHFDVVDSIVSGVISKNRDHQINSGTVLVDRQGIFANVPYKLHQTKEVQKKFISSCNLLELAIVTNRILSVRLDDGGLYDCSQLEKLIATPRVIIKNSVTAKKTWDLLIEEFNLLELLNKCKEEIADKPYVANNNFKKFIYSKEFIIFVLTCIVGLGVYLYQNSSVKEVVENYLSPMEQEESAEDHPESQREVKEE